MFGFQWESSIKSEESFDEGLISAYLDAIVEKLPPMPLSEICRSYEKFRKRVI